MQVNLVVIMIIVATRNELSYLIASYWDIHSPLLIWTIWIEIFNYRFNGFELSILELKSLFLLSLYE